LSSQRLYSTTNSTNQDAYKVAIIGSGPSGCYTAKYLQQAMKKSDIKSTIDILERLPTAYGLVRNGVAPDHPEVKNVQNDFDQLFSAQDSDINLLANVNVGRDVSLQELREMYDIVVCAFGCESDNKLNIPNASLNNILTARQFVNWYNGHPEFDWVGKIVKDALATTSSIQNIVVIGHGNVALDCARILAKTREQLEPTDITTSALEILNPPSSPSPKRIISIVGRRGHVQGAFTIKEVRELTKLGNHAQFLVLKQELEAGLATEASQQELAKARPKQRIDSLLQDNAVVHDDDRSVAKTKVNLRFLLNPIRFEASDKKPHTLGAVICERTELVGETGKQHAQGTGLEEAIPADLSLVSIGYKGIPIEGTERYYDESRGILKNTHGVVDNHDTNLAPLYVSGWLKRGPSGIIGTNIADAKDTVTSIMKDVQENNTVRKPRPVTDLQGLLQERGVHVVDWAAYLHINDAETSPDHKRNQDQPREKITQWELLLHAAKA
jgi:adrenodoxin-NADP+ reductase